MRDTMWIWQKTHPGRPYQDEFRVRLRYLRALGLHLLTKVGDNEYAITQLGRAFLAKGRAEGHYP